MEKQKVLLGLIGFPLAHSLSAGYFNRKFAMTGETDIVYRLFPLTSIDEFHPLLVKYPALRGLNVTHPYKEQVVPYLDELDETARSIGAVNTIKISRLNGIIRTCGFNTDAPGFLDSFHGDFPDGPALILGTGGGSKAVAHVLRTKNIRFSFVSRKNHGPGILNYGDLTADIIKSHPFIINTTPVGMFPETDGFPPIPYQYLSADHCLYDLIYNPEETEFLRRGKIMKSRTLNGMNMLIKQAELSGRIFLESI